MCPPRGTPRRRASGSDSTDTAGRPSATSPTGSLGGNRGLRSWRRGTRKSCRTRMLPWGPMTLSSPTVRERTEQIERQVLSERAALAFESKGRDRDEEPDPLRTGFQRDRDRIVHSKAFRRLKHKTQVFVAPEGDHYRVRLTHTLEVSQIARTAARALRLNEDLTEAIALGHDLGHTPFGHLGEEALSPVLATPFRHNEQSLRIVDYLEN